MYLNCPPAWEPEPRWEAPSQVKGTTACVSWDAAWRHALALRRKRVLLEPLQDSHLRSCASGGLRLLRRKPLHSRADNSYPSASPPAERSPGRVGGKKKQQKPGGSESWRPRRRGRRTPLWMSSCLCPPWARPCPPTSPWAWRWSTRSSTPSCSASSTYSCGWCCGTDTSGWATRPCSCSCACCGRRCAPSSSPSTSGTSWRRTPWDPSPSGCSTAARSACSSSRSASWTCTSLRWVRSRGAGPAVSSCGSAQTQTMQLRSIEIYQLKLAKPELYAKVNTAKSETKQWNMKLAKIIAKC